MKKIVFITVVFSLLGSAVLAQSENEKAKSGSVYSKLGVGYPVSIGNTAAQSMGLLGISYHETFVPSLANPAHWGNTTYGLGTGGARITSYNASNSTSSVNNSNFSMNQFQLQLPIIRGKFGISGSFAPLTEASFRIAENTTQIVDNGVQQDTVSFDIVNRGSGGLNRAELGFGWKINSNISIGYAASVVFLSHDDAFSASTPQVTYRPANFTLETSGAGFGNRVGVYAQLPDFLQDDDKFRIGATVSFPVSLDASREQTGTLNNGRITMTNELASGEGTIKMPLKIGGGLSYSPSQLLTISTEGLYQGWSNYQNNFKTNQQQLFVDRYKIGLGMQYFPYVTGSDKFLSNFKYRTGVSYDTGHLRIQGHKINTLKFSLGLGIPSPNSRSSFDFSLEYGIRGTTTSDLVKEQFWGFSLSVNLAELMFFRPKLQ